MQHLIRFTCHRIIAVCSWLIATTYPKPTGKAFIIKISTPAELTVKPTA